MAVRVLVVDDQQACREAAQFVIGITGLEATRRIVSTHPETEVIVFSTHSSSDYAPRAHEAGALGFIAKADLAPEVLDRVWKQRGL